jgi:serine/threonine-protein kinase
MRPVLLDFGLAKLVEGRASHALTAAGAMVGTPYAASPEQLTDASTVGPQTDVWGIAIVLYEALAGRPPFDGSNWHALMAAILTGPVPPLRERAPWVPAPLAAVVHRALERDLARRVESMRDFLDAMLASLATEPWCEELRRTHRSAPDLPPPAWTLDDFADDGPTTLFAGATRTTDVDPAPTVERPSARADDALASTLPQRVAPVAARRSDAYRRPRGAVVPAVLLGIGALVGVAIVGAMHAVPSRATRDVRAEVAHASGNGVARTELTVPGTPDQGTPSGAPRPVTDSSPDVAVRVPDTPTRPLDAPAHARSRSLTARAGTLRAPSSPIARAPALPTAAPTRPSPLTPATRPTVPILDPP